MVKLVSIDYIAKHFPDLDNNELSVLQSRVGRLVADYLHTSLEEKVYTEVYDSKVTLIPYHLPIISVTSIEDRSSANTIFEEDTNYYVYNNYIQIPGRTSGSKDLRLTYIAGLQSSSPKMEIVAEDIIRFWAFKEGKLDELFLQQENMEDRSYTTKDITEATILTRLRSERYHPLKDLAKGIVRIGVI